MTTGRPLAPIVGHDLPVVDFSPGFGSSRDGYTPPAGTVAMTQTLHAELDGTGVRAHVVCPGIVATEFHEVQNMDLSAVPRMSAQDVVTAALAGIELGDVVIAPGVEDAGLLHAIFSAELAAFNGQQPELSTRYRKAAVEPRSVRPTA